MMARNFLLAGALVAGSLAGCAAPTATPNGTAKSSALNGIYKGNTVFLLNGAYDNCSTGGAAAQLTVVDGTGRLDVAGRKIADATVSDAGAVVLKGPPASGSGSIAGNVFSGSATDGGCGYNLSLSKAAGSEKQVGDAPLTTPKGQMPTSHL